jgi:predicted metal-dependent phosphoesterase TrpH
MKIDLHIHSANSDGEDTVEQLIPKIKAAGVDVFALTDHDRTDGWAKASELANELGLSFIPGIEITTEGRVPDSDGNIEPFGIHLLAYLPNPEDAELLKVLEDNRRDRIQRIKDFVANLKPRYPELSFELVMDKAQKDSTMGRPDIAKALVHLGKFDDVDQVFNSPNSPISKQSPFYVKNNAPDVLDVIKIVRAAGGVPVIAHPLARTSSEDVQPESFPREHFEKMVVAGLLGLETEHKEVNPEIRETLEAFAVEHGLVTTGSSDYHGLGTKPKNPLGLHTTSVEMLQRILELGTGTKPTLNHKF